MRLLKNMPMTDPDDKACRVCGAVTKLSFEHVPPKGVGNSGRVELLGIEDWLRREERGATVKGAISQKGSGAYSLCRDCNSRAGNLYVPELQKLHGSGLEAFRQLDRAALDKADTAGYMEIKAQGVKPGRLTKQIATMLLAISPGSFAAANPELTEYAREPEKVGLSPRYQFYLVLYAGPIARYNGGSIAAHLGGDGSFSAIPVWELAYPPFAYVMTIDEDAPPLEAGNISGFVGVGIDQVAEVTMTLKVGFGHTVFPLDFRTKAVADRERAESEAFSAAIKNVDSATPHPSQSRLT
jgi:hypothetical protein